MPSHDGDDTTAHNRVSQTLYSPALLVSIVVRVIDQTSPKQAQAPSTEHHDRRIDSLREGWTSAMLRKATERCVMAKDPHEPISSSNFVPASVSSEGEPTAINSPREDVQDVLPGIARSIAAFRRELPKLLGEHGGKWVAYHHEDRVGFGSSKTQLYKECLSRFGRGEFIVEFIEPEDPYTELPTMVEDRS